MKTIRTDIVIPTLNDVDTLWRWGRDNWELWGDARYKWFTKKTLRRWINTPEDDVLLVAKVGGVLVGMCIVHVIRDWSFCFGLYVDEGYRGKGIGKQMLREAELMLAARGVESVILLVDVKNDKATKFYSREGFYKGYQFFLMTKELSGHALQD